VTPRINELIKQMAYREGLHVSEWIRNVITNELKKNDMLSTELREPVLKNNQKTRFPLDDM
jgi:hypothetical protein